MRSYALVHFVLDRNTLAEAARGREPVT